tara:strand:+ start:1992 stop:3938 length:1947 start_codon:yes stop_codon:yes gene_type:complete
MAQFARLSITLAMIIVADISTVALGENNLAIDDSNHGNYESINLTFETNFQTSISPTSVPSNLDEDFSVAKSSIGIDRNISIRPLSSDFEINLERIRELRQAGALSLAESLLIESAPERHQVEWFEWQRELWEVQTENGQYDRLVKNLENLVSLVSEDNLYEVLERLVITQQKQGKFLAARVGLRKLFLMTAQDPMRVSRLRRILIRNYIESDFLMDAADASIRYQEEYLPDDTEWNLLRAEILIKIGEPSKAIIQLVGLQNLKARLMLKLARLYEGSIKPVTVIEDLSSLGEMPIESFELNYFRMGIIAEAARMASDLRVRLKMQEILLGSNVAELSMLPELTTEVLLKTYSAIAVNEGNANNLLVGDYLSWIEYAKSIQSKNADIARSIYAFLLQEEVSIDARKGAYEGLIGLLLKERQYALVSYLYDEGSLISGIPPVSQNLLLTWSRFALEGRDYKTAMNLARAINVVPNEFTNWAWELYIARLEIFSGSSVEGADRLLNILERHDQLQEAQLDQYLQVVFDLQTIERHDLAMTLFKSVEPFTNSLRQKRELLFWMGESQIGQQKFAQAADLFLQSSEIGNQNSDLWGQSARFRAAEALVDASLFNDAFNIYQTLLEESQDQTRRFQLQQKLQKINLQRAVGIR